MRVIAISLALALTAGCGIDLIGLDHVGQLRTESEVAGVDLVEGGVDDESGGVRVQATFSAEAREQIDAALADAGDGWDPPYTCRNDCFASYGAVVRDADGVAHAIAWRDDGSPPDELARLELVVERILDNVARARTTRACGGWLEECVFTPP